LDAAGLLVGTYWRNGRAVVLAAQGEATAICVD
jgi:hypothetical protein